MCIIRVRYRAAEIVTLRPDREPLLLAGHALSGMDALLCTESRQSRESANFGADEHRKRVVMCPNCIATLFIKLGLQ
jgi:hypothetical protein